MRNEYISNYISNIGVELACIRKKQRLKITDVSKKTGINKDTISTYENGKSTMKISILEKLLNFYNINSSIFFKTIDDRMQ